MRAFLVSPTGQVHCWLRTARQTGAEMEGGYEDSPPCGRCCSTVTGISPTLEQLRDRGTPQLDRGPLFWRGTERHPPCGSSPRRFHFVPEKLRFLPI